MSESRKSQVDPEAKPDDRVDNALRPQKLAELIGQDQVKENLGILMAAARKRGRRSIMSYSTVRLGSVKQPWPM